MNDVSVSTLADRVGEEALFERTNLSPFFCFLSQGQCSQSENVQLLVHDVEHMDELHFINVNWEPSCVYKVGH